MMDALSSFVYGRSEKYEAENFSAADRNRNISGDSNNNSFPIDMTSMAHSSSTCCAIHSDHENGICDGNSNYESAEKSLDVPQAALPINYSPHAFYPFPSTSLPPETGKSAEAIQLMSSTSQPIAHTPHPFQLYSSASPPSLYTAASSMQTGTLNTSCYPIPSYPVYGRGKISDTGRLRPTSQIHFLSPYEIMKPKCVKPNCCYSANNMKYLPCLSTQKNNYKMLNPSPQNYTTLSPASLNYRLTPMPASNSSHTSGTSYSASEYTSGISENANRKETDTEVTCSDNENNNGISSEDSNPEIVNYQMLETHVESIVPENREECIFPDNTNEKDEKHESISESKSEKNNEVISITIGDLLCETLANAKKNRENQEINELNTDSAKPKKNLENQVIKELNADSTKVKKNEDNQDIEELNDYSKNSYLHSLNLKEKSDKNPGSNPQPKNLSLEKYNPKTAKKVSCKEKSNAPRPPLSYVALIREAILSSPEKRLTLEYIYNYIVQKYEYFRTCGISWKNSIRHNLSLNKCFTRIVKEGGDRKGGNWTYDSRYDSQFQNNNFRRRTRMRRCTKSILTESTTSGPAKPPPTPTVRKTYPSPYPQQYLSYSANFMAHNCRYLAPDDKSYPLAHMSNTMRSSDRSNINAYPTYAQRIQAQRMQDLHVRYVHSHQINSTVLPSVPTTLTMPSAYSGNSYVSRASTLGYTACQPLQEPSWGTQDNLYHPY